MNSRSYIAIAVAAALALSIALAPEGWTQTPAGAEFRVNTYGTSQQRRPALVKRANGDFVITWHSDGPVGDQYDVLGQRFSAAGGPQGAPFAVNTYTTDYQYWPKMSADARGNFVVAWNSYDQDGSRWGVFGQRFNASGTRVGAEFRANTFTTGYQFVPQPALAANGSFVVVWSSFYPGGQDGSEAAIIGRRFDINGAPIGGEFQVNTYTTGYQVYASVGATPGGSFVVAWQSKQDGSYYGIVARRFDASGSPVGGEFIVNSTTTGYQVRPSVAVNANGSFVVVFHSPDGPQSFDLRARLFDSSGSPVGADFAVNTYTTGTQYGYAVSTDAQGNFVVAWSSAAGDGSGYGVFGQRFSASGARRGAEFRVNTYTTDEQDAAAIASDAVGNFDVSWRSFPDQDGSRSGVFAQRFGGLLPTALRVDTVGGGGTGNGNGVWEPAEATVDARPSWHNVNGAPQTISGALANITGPAGPTYSIPDPATGYGTIPNLNSAECAAGDCYHVGVANGSPRPTLHWDVSVVETLAPDVQGQQKTWRLHVGDSFTDVPPSSPFYRFVEILLHHSITGGCAAAQFCPGSSTTREQMAALMLVAKEGPGYAPPACTTPVFNDVPASNPFCRFIEELVRRGITGGCGNGIYCPNAAVTREQLAVFVLRTLDPAFTPPPCVPPNIFNDVPETSPFCPYVEEIFRRNVASGCGNGNFCPTVSVSREQMSVFISVTFGLILYGP